MPQEASVIPFEDWNDGYANVMPMPPGPTDMPTVVPLENRPAGNHQITRLDYPLGLVILVTGSPPNGTPAYLTLVWEDGQSVSVGTGSGSNSNGVVVLFRGQ